MNEERPISVLIPDGDDHTLLVLQVLNCLSLEKHVDVYVMTAKQTNYLKYSRYVKRLLYYPETTTKAWIDQINREVNTYKIDVILPVFEFAFEKLIKHKTELQEPQKLCPLPDIKHFKIAIDKGQLYHHLKTNSMPCPESVVTKPNEIPETLPIKFPVIAKPVTGFGGGQQIKVLKNNEEMTAYCRSITFDCDIIFQDYIEGHDISCNVICLDGDIKAYNMQKGSVFQSGEASPQIGFDFFKSSKVLDVISELMQSLKWSGVANLDVRYDKINDNYKIIEINPRFWMNTDASVVAGINFPYLCCLLAIEDSIPNVEAKDMTYFNLKGLTRQLAKRPGLLFNVSFLRHNTPLLFALKDPLPMVYKFVWRTKNIIVGKFKKRND